MKLKDAKELMTGLTTVGQHQNTKFSTVVVKNFLELQEKIDVFEELLDNELPEYKDVAKKLKQFKTKHLKADPGKKTIIERQFEKYKDEVQELINERQELEEQYSNKDIDFKPILINEEHLPDNLTAAQILVLKPIIKFS